LLIAELVVATGDPALVVAPAPAAPRALTGGVSVAAEAV
jgi:hypothetical protein